MKAPIAFCITNNLAAIITTLLSVKQIYYRAKGDGTKGTPYGSGQIKLMFHVKHF